ncbi:hypothetical protein TREMEDRAFT_38404 [Tremella mesenterica DSM 1558]|uniref:uncharacterized protein n=1 Tax=Tremella mesenterica (strain ATCC 24925 / CBS 8224 / DSM 1558 / NBRC 9311 / NRRL Y-6157 / RJB 2259-6 / UBC 559-6) TaxID=578456 RepID=UPI0003F4912D|nr:uncharacterized protein TREMEDRAFT_38404 [Tremella mesenterica DSM 1558]EIW70791.1 hypothetical protein TREMEDRAFT_38404 [Tremella mesenterica DSM 1558]
MSSLTSPIDPIIIVGSGPAGLLLARYLQLHNLPCKLYERNPSPSHRPQGGTLDLHTGTGLRALKETGLLEDAQKLMRPEGEAMKVMNRSGNVLWDENGDGAWVTPGSRPEIDRTDLRNLLLSSLTPDTVSWGHEITSCIALTPTEYQITFFPPHPPVITSILIGADGAFSRIRPLLHDKRPTYTGVSMYDLLISPPNLTPTLSKFVGQGAALILHEGKCVLPQMNSGGRCKIYAALRVGEKWLDEYPLPAEGKKEAVARLFPEDEGWTGKARELIEAADEDSVVSRRIYGYPPGLKWKTDLTGVTVIGDAAHVMSPFAGEGVNQALADALLLGKTLVNTYYNSFPKSTSPAPFPLSLFPVSPPPRSIPRTPSPATLHAALRTFESRMMRRVDPELRGSAENLEMFMGPHAAERVHNFFRYMPLVFLKQVTKMGPWGWWQAVRVWWDDD